ncbi:hypothetical protein ITJ46_08590 [Rathayibacter sp. VKM Ac-2878]|nr:hypothetical protein [Rathayibacter sp. VKM Ac-2879]MBF4503994.1 hypothetical protein [Rathayibacter sp. VKM Ac-2878]
MLRGAVLASLSVPALLLAGCAGLAPDTVAAGTTAMAFEAAVAAADGATACAALTPRAAQAVVDAVEGAGSCAEAIVTLDLAEATGAPRAEAYGQAAIVELEGDTVFLAASGDGWRVRAAGCTISGEDLPLDCVIDGS